MSLDLQAYYQENQASLDLLSAGWKALCNSHVRPEDIYLQEDIPDIIDCTMQPMPLLQKESIAEQLCTYYKSSCQFILDGIFSETWGSYREILAFYGITADEQFLKLNLGHPFFDPLQVMMRGDFVFDGNAFHCIENNLGSGIGGMDTVYHRHWYWKRIKPFMPEDILSSKTREPFEDMVNGVANQALRHGFGADGELNCLLSVTAQIESLIAPVVQRVYAKVMAEKGLVGTLILTPTKPEFTRRDGRLYCAGTRIDIVDHMYNFDVSSAYFDLKVMCIENLMLGMLSDKRTSQILFQNRHKVDSEIVKSPRTFVLGDRSNFASYNDEKNIQELREEKDKFVLKAADGEGGKAVYVGKGMSQEEWNACVTEHETDNLYVVQEYIQSMPFPAVIDGAFVPHNANWSTFYAFDNECGSIARIAAQDDNRHVITSSTGTTLLLDLKR